ncbi:MAG: hypothetical protein DMF70_06395 [Acidobacteria bacterium]|nr:MAG: hypothetical protein DMF70_06395 [Acidobacteriota bacterium]
MRVLSMGRTVFSSVVLAGRQYEIKRVFDQALTQPSPKGRGSQRVGMTVRSIVEVKLRVSKFPWYQKNASAGIIRI